MSKLTHEELRAWLLRERDYWRIQNREGWIMKRVAQGTEVPMEDAIDQLIDILGPVREPDEVVSVIDARLGAGWTKALALALGPPHSQPK